ncbi:Uncharacterized protein TPAR_05588 [Tolypocladium paradoxum]|uniref:Uncharacterized protein n=1 Tax=Tolypocladium paradoxum TaxID=94208 RepID=A0A2S4KVG9_9HYPO|nr:Uncharacterized protein TPAR_05588 [Tolypocladium paradoxum]
MEAPPCQRSDSAATSKTPSGLETLSIHERARCRPRSRIVVEPLLWTKLQLELLGCSFSGPCPAPPAIMKLEYPSDARRRQTFEAYFTGNRHNDREGAMRCLMGGIDGPLETFSDLYFHLGGYRNILLRCSYFCLRDECEGDNPGPVPPVVAHIDHRYLVWMRELHICRSYSGSIRKIKIRRFASTEPLHEPYLVALLIALAQRQWRSLGPEMTKQVSGVKPMVLYTTDDSEFMYLYATNVSSVLIDMFHDPAVAPTTPQSLPVQITAIACKPFDTLRDRVMALTPHLTPLGGCITDAALRQLLVRPGHEGQDMRRNDLSMVHQLDVKPGGRVGPQNAFQGRLAWAGA